MRNREIPDWQLGNESKTTPLKRIDLMIEWLKQNKKDILEKIRPEEPEQETIGFIDL